jgi:sodium transport system permease protein
MSQASLPTESTEAPRSNSTFSWLKRLARKELYEILRDRRTIITLILMPILVYPLLSVAFRTLALSGMTSNSGEGAIWAVEFEDYEQAEAIDRLLGGELTIEDVRSRQYQAELANANGKPIAPPSAPLWQITYEGANNEKMATNVREGVVDLGVRLLSPLGEGSPGARKAGEPVRIELLSNSSSASRELKEWFTSRITRINDAYRINELKRLNQKVTTLVEIEDRKAILEDQPTTISFAALMPLILVLMTITGAVYPAIDLTAGERERNTLEALIASPAPRFALLLAKYSAVLTVAMLTALMNLTAMSATIWLLGLGKDIFGAGGFSVLAIVQVAGLMMLFAAFFSGLLLAVTSFARSFKEAQAYLIPLMLVALAPGMMSLMPGIKLEGPLVVTPLVNLVLLTRDLLLNKASNEVALIVVFSTALYAMAAVALAARVFGADSVLYGREGSWSELFTRPRESAPKPSVSAAFLCLSALFVLTFLAQSAFAIWFKPPPGTDAPKLEGPILASGLGNLLIFGGVCLGFAWLGKVSWSSILPSRAPSPLVVVAALILGVASWPLAHEILAWMNDLGIAAISQSQLLKVSKLAKNWAGVSIVITILSIGLITPIGEEIAFRGYLFSAFTSKKKPWRVIFITAVLFAAFHVVAPGVLSFERFMPSLFLGIILGFIRYQSGSIWPSLAIHVIHNSLLLLFLAKREELEKSGLGVASEGLHLPLPWQLGSLLAVAVAIGLVWASRRRESVAIAAPATT